MNWMFFNDCPSPLKRNGIFDLRKISDLSYITTKNCLLQISKHVYWTNFQAILFTCISISSEELSWQMLCIKKKLALEFQLDLGLIVKFFLQSTFPIWCDFTGILFKSVNLVGGPKLFCAAAARSSSFHMNRRKSCGSHSLCLELDVRALRFEDKNLQRNEIKMNLFQIYKCFLES